METRTKRREYSYGLFSHWISFTIGFGAFIMMILLSNLVKPIHFPLLAIFFSFLLFSVIRISRRRDSTSCMLIVYIIARTLAEYAIIMLLIGAAFRFGGDKIIINSDNRLIEFINFPILILSLILIANTIIVAIKKNKCTFCTICLLRNGAPSERGVTGRLHSTETMRFIKQIFGLSIILAVVSWGYFLCFYTGVTVSNFDNIVFVGVPVVLWIIHEISVAIRCWVLTGYCERKKTIGGLFVKDFTLLRYLLVCDNKLYMSFEGHTSLRQDKMDTPIKKYIPFQDKVSTQLAMSTFEELTGVNNNGSLKYLYSFVDMNNNCSANHYIYFLDSMQDIENINGEWIKFSDIEQAFAEKKLDGALKNELYRLYTAMTTYKTYNTDGTRKFRIKGYKPSFTLDDLKSINIDYVDPKLMLLSQNNEDIKFYRIKKWWFKYIEGLID